MQQINGVQCDISPWTYLRGADLCGANLHGADLEGANLHGANLHGADLHGADLRWANLHGANLEGANLHRANLHRANLREANLEGANLEGTCLDPAVFPRRPTQTEIEAAGLELIGGRVYGWRTAASQHSGSTDYMVPGEYQAPVFSIDESTPCHPGIYFSSLVWLSKNYPACAFVRCWAHWHEICHARDKWRARRLVSEGFRP